ncbi:MAG: ribose 5-phosphate isomerase B [Candidatus Nanoarchaeia archaeon]
MAKRGGNVILGSDHAGHRVKEMIKEYLDDKDIPYDDLGSDGMKDDDYPDYAFAVARKVAKSNSRGILICGTGTGMVIAANKIKGIRAVAAYDTYTAKMSRHDNDANILCLRGRFFPIGRIRQIVAVWLRTPFSNEPRHKRRVEKIKREE